MYCPNCAQPNVDSAVTCSRCGASLPTQMYASPSTPATYEKVDNYLVWAILATLFCCLPTGIVAIVYAAQVDSKVGAGDVAGARQSARNAATWSWVSLGLGLLFILLYFGLVAVSISLGR